MRKVVVVTLAILLPVVVAAVVMAPRPLAAHSAPVALPQDLHAYLQQRETQAANRFGLIPGTEKRIRWLDGKRKRKTPYSIVYLHGFSATRQELAPVAELIADALAANLFETRLAGHGRENRALENVRAEDWLHDAVEALSIGARLGDDVVVIGTSTGATLAVAALGHPAAASVSTVVMISPNFAPLDRFAEWLTFPGGSQLGYLVVGRTYKWQAKNYLQARYWTTEYPLDSIIEMMRLVQFTRAQLPMSTEKRILTIMSPLDKVVSAEETRAALLRLTATENHLLEYSASSDDGQHVLAGDILSPGSNEQIAAHIIEFISGNSR